VGGPGTNELPQAAETARADPETQVVRPAGWRTTERSAVVAAAGGTARALLIFDPSQVASGMLLATGTYTIGRGPRCEICLHDAEASRRHCQLRVDAASVWLHDLDSTNGTFVNGARIESRELARGDVIGIGVSTLRLVDCASTEWRAHRSLAEQACSDDLSGLLNRRGFRQRVDAALSGSRAHGPLALLMLDADQFRTINERHGHGGGDRVIRHIGRCITAALPPGGFAGRVGGEEFAVVLPPDAAAGARDWAETLRETIARDAARETAIASAVTVSIGVAVGRFPFELRTLFASADRALFRAKSEGRNRVCGPD
jgi:diguanylate cyclase (GGDEF)-like protein